MLDRRANEKLQAEPERLHQEGWKWIAGCDRVAEFSVVKGAHRQAFTVFDCGCDDFATITGTLFR